MHDEKTTIPINGTGNGEPAFPEELLCHSMLIRDGSERGEEGPPFGEAGAPPHGESEGQESGNAAGGEPDQSKELMDLERSRCETYYQKVKREIAEYLLERQSRVDDLREKALERKRHCCKAHVRDVDDAFHMPAERVGRTAKHDPGSYRPGGDLHERPVRRRGTPGRTVPIPAEPKTTNLLPEFSEPMEKGSTKDSVFRRGPAFGKIRETDVLPDRFRDRKIQGKTSGAGCSPSLRNDPPGRGDELSFSRIRRDGDSPAEAMRMDRNGRRFFATAFPRSLMKI